MRMATLPAGWVGIASRAGEKGRSGASLGHPRWKEWTWAGKARSAAWTRLGASLVVTAICLTTVCTVVASRRGECFAWGLHATLMRRR